MQEDKNPKGPLAGIKVLELGTLIAGPFCARMLGEFGADVIKIESPQGGDPIRQWRVLKDDNSLWWSVQSRNKKSITLNMKDKRAQDIARRLALDADIVIENYRPGVLEKWNLGYESLKAINPALIMVRLSGNTIRLPAIPACAKKLPIEQACPNTIVDTSHLINCMVS
jgi:formyl-CoA transferase